MEPQRSRVQPPRQLLGEDRAGVVERPVEPRRRLRDDRHDGLLLLRGRQREPDEAEVAALAGRLVLARDAVQLELQVLELLLEPATGRRVEVGARSSAPARPTWVASLPIRCASTLYAFWRSTSETAWDTIVPRPESFTSAVCMCSVGTRRTSTASPCCAPGVEYATLTT